LSDRIKTLHGEIPPRFYAEKGLVKDVEKPLRELYEERMGWAERTDGWGRDENALMSMFDMFAV
jgi:hypothetical protein